jgi:DNA-directed RNA polymerase subunit M/transcription elongation factor TFIIS
MIRFACPGCEATYTVPDEKAGKTGKCPKCQAQFVIPTPPPAAAAAPPPRPDPTPPPSAATDVEVEIAPCPGCQARLMVSTGDLGTDVECPYCKTVYRAETPGARSEAAEPRPRRRPAADVEERPSRRRRDDDDEDERTSRRRRDEDEDDDPRPRRKRDRRDLEPHRGTMILVLGILSFVGCGIFTAIPAWVMGTTDIRKIDAGRMNPDGRGTTQAGRILGMASCILTVVFTLLYCVIVGLAVGAGPGPKGR